MSNLDPVFLFTLSDLLVNLSAGWFGAAIIVPAVSKKPVGVNFWVLIFNLLLGIVFLILGFELKKFGTIL